MWYRARISKTVRFYIQLRSGNSFDDVGTKLYYTLLFPWTKNRKQWSNGKILMVLLYRELATGKSARERLHIRLKNVCKRDMKKMGMHFKRWEDIARDWSRWRHDFLLRLDRGNEGVPRRRSMLDGKQTTRSRWGSGLHMHSLQLRRSLLCEAVSP